MTSKVVDLAVFHDERLLGKQWLYHGYVLCETGDLPRLVARLNQAKAQAGCAHDKRIHFAELNSSSAGSTRTMTAKKWASLFTYRLYGSMWFYLFGVHLANVDYNFFGRPSEGQRRHVRLYNSFFEIGLFAACRYFFDFDTEVRLEQIFSEKRDLESDNPFLTDAPFKINRRESNITVKCKEVVQIASAPSAERVYPEYVSLVNLVDVLTGGFSQVIDCSSSASGCMEVAQGLFPVCGRLSANPYNQNSRYYKRYALSFFPKNRVSRSEILKYGVRPPGGQFYNSRKLLFRQYIMNGFEELIR